jgi:hypothetical protein
VAGALRSLDARLRVKGLPEGLAVPIDGRFLANLELSTWRTRAGDVDVVRRARVIFFIEGSFPAR